MQYRKSKFALSVIAALSALGSASAVHAKASPEEIARLGKDLTCIGAEKTGTASGVAEFTGKWNGAAPGMTTEPGKHPVDPYASEKPLLTITAQNMAQHADKLSPGQQAMFKKYPNTYKMHIYPSHRDFAYDESICQVVAKNAAEAELSADGASAPTANKGGVPFPFPKSGLELVWNGNFPSRAFVEYRDTDLAMVYANGTIQWGAQLFWALNRNNDPKLRGTRHEGVGNYGRIVALLPEREKGAMTRTIDDFTLGKGARLAWQYIPGNRRVRQAPDFGFDMPNPSTGGTLTIDEMRLFNGSHERYDWKLIGKKEMYIPYNGYKLESPAVGSNKYAKLLTPHHENPDFVRWELHRVWVLEGKIKKNYRHLYATRILYLDEDSWQYVMSDIFDTRGNLWRYNWINTYYLPGPNIFNQVTAFYHDLHSGNYTAYDLTQAKPKTAVIDAPGVEYANTAFYSIENLSNSGY
ncbi:conserved exported protein of unknown function [Sterolibacterium denitrificans]|uniref:DUF1329 domain-containing protein n=1 Tax=Sterolibacterium denitrificans TaxID=157592 RepID=A0A7Z7MUZ4_9PROT|nr:DUF1329 domain-containing protein [Sterolibacterium denitrificans]SMB25047.1 conserved exported protein of unknown function [Sterolibacterium denitrificans]